MISEKQSRVSIAHGKPMSIPKSFSMGFYFSVSLLVVLFLDNVLSESHKKTCADFYTCGECIQNLTCGWCSHTKASSESHLGAKCFDLAELSENCDDKNQEKPVGVKIDKWKNAPLYDLKNGSGVYLQPQEINIEISPGKIKEVPFLFLKAKDYPIDLYYLLDFSASMEKYKEALRNTSATLVNELKSRTNSLQLGFGGFVDKVVAPFCDTDPDYLNEKNGLCKNCDLPYAFKNHMALSKEVHKFSEKLAKIAMSHNYDVAEGGFDGLMQVVVCPQQINWRLNSRRVIVFCTDAPYHIAGDGKLAGIVEPNDGECHLNERGEYTHSLIFDYPSISQVAKKVKQSFTSIIFAVTKSVTEKYRQLSHKIESSDVIFLESSKDIVSKVMTNLNDLSLSVELTHNATGQVKIAFYSKCPGQENWEMGNKCPNVKGGEQVPFSIKIQVGDCSVPDQTIEIKPIGAKDSLMVHLKVHCKCDCEKSKNWQEKSEKCSKVGKLICGHCSCPKSHSGQRCECENKNDGERPLNNILESCRRDNLTCSNRGTCICGECRCFKPPGQINNPHWNYSGKFCQCDNFSCPGGSTCSGRGQCVCGDCKCNEGWTGDKCECTTKTDGCSIDGTITELCTGRGDCVCGQCQCHTMGSAGKTYTGKYCERCTECQVKCTKEMELCIQCLVHDNPDKQTQCSRECQEMFKNITTVPDVRGFANIKISSALCEPYEADENGCSFKYVPFYQGDDLWVLANHKKTCPIKLNITAIASGVAGSVILAGLLLLLIWKVVTTVHDKREFEKFEKQRADTHWGKEDNPLYRKAMTTHINPIFGMEEK